MAESSLVIQVAAGLKEKGDSIVWMSPGVPASANSPNSLEFDFLATKDCFLYVIALPEHGANAQVIWPTLNGPEMKRAHADEILSFSIDTPSLADWINSGSLAVLVFSKPPVRFHASLGQGRPPLDSVKREIKALLRDSSPFIVEGDKYLIPIASIIRSSVGEIRGLQSPVTSYWAGVYEWSRPKND